MPYPQHLPVMPPEYVWPPTPGAVFTYAYCLNRIILVDTAIDAALKSGVAEYHVGSRGLKRYTLPELQAMREYWVTKANDSLSGGSSMKCKRGVPCDA